MRRLVGASRLFQGLNRTPVRWCHNVAGGFGRASSAGADLVFAVQPVDGLRLRRPPEFDRRVTRVGLDGFPFAVWARDCRWSEDSEISVVAVRLDPRDVDAVVADREQIGVAFDRRAAAAEVPRT